MWLLTGSLLASYVRVLAGVLELGVTVGAELEGAAAEELEPTVGLGGGLAAFRLRLWVRAACGVRRTSDARARATTAASPRTVLSSIRATRHALDTPPLNTAANPACDPPGVRAGARGREIPDEKAMMTTPAAVARPAATAATIRRSALAREMPRIVLRGRPRGTSTLGGWEDPRVPARPADLTSGWAGFAAGCSAS